MSIAGNFSVALTSMNQVTSPSRFVLRAWSWSVVTGHEPRACMAQEQVSTKLEALVCVRECKHEGFKLTAQTNKCIYNNEKGSEAIHDLLRFSLSSTPA